MTDYNMIKRNTHELPTPKGQGIHSESTLDLTTPSESQHYESGGLPRDPSRAGRPGGGTKRDYHKPSTGKHGY